MPQSPSNACFSLPLHSHPLHILPPTHSLHLTSLSLALSFLLPLMKTTPRLALAFPLNLPFIQPPPLPFLTACVVSNSHLFSLHLCPSFFSFSSHHAGRLLALGPAAYPSYSLIVYPDYFSGGHLVSALHHTVLSSSSSGSEWVGVEAGCSGLWQTGGP